MEYWLVQLTQTLFLFLSTQALYASKIVSYAQGFMLMREMSTQNNWKLNYGGIALMWRGGCIIRSAFLGDIKSAFTKNPELTSLLLDDFFKAAIEKCQVGWAAIKVNQWSNESKYSKLKKL